jgi:hypothetical protein
MALLILLDAMNLQCLVVVGYMLLVLFEANLGLNTSSWQPQMVQDGVAG